MTSVKSSVSQIQLLDQWSLKGRIYVVTGGAAGIGLSIVQTLLTHQAKIVYFCSRNDCIDVITDLQSNWCIDSQKVIHIKCDVSNVDGRQKLLNVISKDVNEIHGLINNVGTNVRKTIEEQTDDEYNTIMRTNIDSTYYLCKMLKPLLMNGAGTGTASTVVNVSSAAGVRSSGTGISYAMSKAAINQLTKTLACEWAKSNIRVNAIAPWMTMTPMLEKAISTTTAADGGVVAVADTNDPFNKVKNWTPMHRLAKPEEIAAPVIFLLLPCSSYITGQIISVDGGLDAQAFDGPCVT